MALDKGRAFSDDSRGRYANSDYWIPWDIIEFVSIPYDRGWRVTVEDSRLLNFIVEEKCNVTGLNP